MIRYEAEEWDQLFEIVWKMRMKDQQSALKTLVDRAMAQMPRKRKMQSFEPLLERFAMRMEQLEADAERGHRLAQMPKGTTREEVIKSLTDEELVSLFGKRVLGQLIKNLEKKVIHPVRVDDDPARMGPTPPILRKPKVCIYGLRGAQLHHLQEKLPDVDLISVEQFQVPPKSEATIAWIDFIRHGSYPVHATRYSGGLEGMVRLITELLES